MKIISSWSGGKDSCYAFMTAIEKGHIPTVLLNMMNEKGKVSRSHGIPLALLKEQANAMNLPITTCASTWGNYEYNFINTLKKIKQSYQVETVVFGDIDIESHKQWEEKVCEAANLKPLLPLWKQNRKRLVFDMIDAGIKAIIVSCNITLGVDFLGKEITKELVEELEKIGVDCCGENGEYHTLVLDCPLFTVPLKTPNFEKN